jgi:hypothetical protein
LTVDLLFVVETTKETKKKSKPIGKKELFHIKMALPNIQQETIKS